MQPPYGVASCSLRGTPRNNRHPFLADAFRIRYKDRPLCAGLAGCGLKPPGALVDCCLDHNANKVFARSVAGADGGSCGKVAAGSRYDSDSAGVRWVGVPP